MEWRCQSHLADCRPGLLVQHGVGVFRVGLLVGLIMKDCFLLGGNMGNIKNVTDFLWVCLISAWKVLL